MISMVLWVSFLVILAVGVILSIVPMMKKQEVDWAKYADANMTDVDWDIPEWSYFASSEEEDDAV